MYRIKTKPAMMVSQYRLYEITLPYVAEFCQPRIPLKMPQPPPPLSSGLPNYRPLAGVATHVTVEVAYVYVPHALIDVV